MAEGAAPSVAVRPIRWSGLWLALGALVLVLVAGLLLGAAAILLVGCVVAGFGITYLSGIALNLEERLAFGTVLGAMAVSVASFVLSMVPAIEARRMRPMGNTTNPLVWSERVTISVSRYGRIFAKALSNLGP